VKNISRAFLLCAVAALLLSLPLPQAAAAGQTVVTAAQVNGTWNSKNGSFKVWALGNQKLQVEFTGTYEYNSPSGPMANTGSGGGVAFIEGNTAVFKPEGAEDECKIPMKFVRARLIVKQEGSCGFGLNVTADGTYRKVSRRKPKFE
jgi:hypothetical protein